MFRRATGIDESVGDGRGGVADISVRFSLGGHLGWTSAEVRPEVLSLQIFRNARLS